MKLYNLFKKETANTKTVSVQKLEKTQLKKVIGGGDGDINTPQANSRMNYFNCWPSK